MMKKSVKILVSIAAILLLSIGGESIVAQEQGVTKLATLYYRRGGTYPTEEHRKELDEIIVLMSCDKEMRVVVVSHVDKSGERAVNDLVSEFRAQNVVDYMCGRIFVDGKLEPKRFRTVLEGVDYTAPSDSLARRVEIFREVDEPAVERVGESGIEEAMLAKANMSLDVAESTTTAITTTLSTALAKKAERDEAAEAAEPKVEEAIEERAISFRSNLLYWCVGMINGGVEWRPGSRRVGVVVNGGYSPFASQDWEHNMGGFFVAPELRCYMGQRKRGYLGLQGIVAGYNYKMSSTGYQGEMYGGGVVGGYKALISKHFDLDLTIGAGFAQFNYGSYRIIYNGMSLYEEYDIEKRAWAPLQLGVSLNFGRY